MQLVEGDPGQRPEPRLPPEVISAIKGAVFSWLLSRPEVELAPHELLVRILRAATADGPAVVVFEDVTAPDRQLIFEIVVHLREDFTSPNYW